MTNWQSVLLAFGGNTALLAVLAFIAKSLFEKLIVRDTRVFESELKSKTDSEIERLKSDMARNIESYKIKLKKSEILFEHELAAASEYSSLFYSIFPGYKHPDMDWYDAWETIAFDFKRIEALLQDCMFKHGAILNDEERSILGKARANAGFGKFDITDGEVSIESVEKAKITYDMLDDLKSKLINRVRAQASL